MKRIGIFCFYDSAGVVDRYVEYFLEQLCPFLDRLVIVCNGNVDKSGKEKLKNFSSEIIMRPNEGYDISAYCQGMLAIGWDELELFDEVILFNDTVYGPIYPFQEVFTKMDEQKQLDFWGMTRYHGHENPKMRDLYPEHIQSYWTVFRKRLLKSEDFRSYWENLKTIRSYNDAVQGHEAIFTKKFEKMGYQWDVYVDTCDVEDVISYPLFHMPFEMIVHKRCPIIKKKAFTVDYITTLKSSIGNQLRDAFRYIQTSTDYNVDLIWDNLLRTSHFSDIKNNLHLNYILPETLAASEKKSEKIGMVLHIYYEDQIESCFHYVQSMPLGTNIFVTTSSEEKKKRIEEKVLELLHEYSVQVEIVPNRGRDVGAMLLGAKDFILSYDLICFAHDKKTTQIKPGLIGMGFSYKCFEGILRSREYVTQVIQLFSTSLRLGVAFPPPPNHALYYAVLGNEWSGNYEGAVQLCNKLNITVPISEKKEPIAPLGSMFWFRVDALKPLFNVEWQVEDFEEEPAGKDGTLPYIIERIHPFVAQSQGYFSGWILPQSLAEIELTNLTYSLQRINKQWRRIQKFKWLSDVEKGIKNLRKYWIKRFFSKSYWRQKFNS